MWYVTCNPFAFTVNVIIRSLFRRWSWQSNILNHFMHYTSYVVRLRYDQSTYNIRLHCGLIK